MRVSRRNQIVTRNICPNLLDCEREMSEDNGAHANLAGNEHPSPSQDAGAAANLVGCEGEEVEIEEDDPRCLRSCHFTPSEIYFNDTLSGVQSTLPTPCLLFLLEELVDSVVQETNRIHYVQDLLIHTDATTDIRHFEGLGISGSVVITMLQTNAHFHVLSTVNTSIMLDTGKLDYVIGERNMKPDCVLEYNKKMGAVYKVDMQNSFVECARKSIKWYTTLFFHLIDIGLLNGHIVHRQVRGQMISYQPYRIYLMRQLLEDLLSFTMGAKSSKGETCLPDPLTGPVKVMADKCGRTFWNRKKLQGFETTKKGKATPTLVVQQQPAQPSPPPQLYPEQDLIQLQDQQTPRRRPMSSGNPFLTPPTLTPVSGVDGL
ncbi:unnamed protein product [Coregonus sp. 'balchen']|nr:unnamed protein product [Coregonus sp. 'balchen']